MHEAYEELIYSIILQAIKDLTWATGQIKKHPEDLFAHRLLSDVERFFLSDWFAQLSSYDGEWILKILKEKLK